MWKIFVESVWGFLWGKVVTILGLVGSAQTIATLIKPDYVITIAGLKFDYRVWFILTLVLLIGIILRILHVANQYKCALEAKDKVSIVYNENLYPACRQIRDNIESIRLGIRVIGKNAVDNIEVFPKHIYDITRGNHKKMKVNRFSLEPMIPDMLSRPINPGLTPTCFVNFISHKIGTRDIAFCLRGCPNEYISLHSGKYEIEVEARGSGNQHRDKTLHLAITNNGNIKLWVVKGDVYDM